MSMLPSKGGIYEAKAYDKRNARTHRKRQGANQKMFEIVREFVTMIANTFFSLIPLLRQLTDFRNAAIATIFGVPAILLTIYADFKLIKKFTKLFR